ncbi:MAG: hypothetical protein M3Z09_09345 [Acidobacteriota bacterium]|nr:hypothetical protein [Acidobacteriota bacterium]
MALREVKVTLHNETPFTLRLQGVYLPSGDWQAEPPTLIAAGETGEWQTGSPGWLRGTEGAAAYLIDDAKALGTGVNDRHQSGCMTINWENPYIGAPKTHGAFHACEGLLESADPTRDYKLQYTASTGSEPMYGWKEAILGNPFGALGGAQTIYFWYRLRYTPTRTSSGPLVEEGGFTSDGLSDPPPLSARSMTSQPETAWVGTWAEIALGEPTFMVTIMSSGTSGFWVKVENRSTSGIDQYNDLAVTKIAATPFIDPVWTDDSPDSAISMMQKPNLGDVTTQLPDFSSSSVIGTSEVSDTSGVALASGALTPTTSDLDIQVMMVDTLVLDSSTRLELFGDFAPDKTRHRYRVRYVRSATGGGHVIMDLLLYPREILR